MECFNGLLDIYKQNFPSNLPTILDRIKEIELLKGNQGKLKEAFEYLTNLLDIYEQDNHSIADANNKENDQSKYEKALENYERSLKMLLETLPSNHPLKASVHNNIGTVLKKQGKYEEALEHFYQSLNIRKEILPSNHSLIVNCYNYNGSLLNNQGNMKKHLRITSGHLKYF